MRKLILYIIALSALTAESTTFKSFSALLMTGYSCSVALGTGVYSVGGAAPAPPKLLKYPLFRSAHDVVVPSLEFRDHKLDASELRSVRSASVEKSLNDIKKTANKTDARSVEKLKTYLIYSPHSEARLAAAHAIASHSNQDLHWHLWFAEYLEADLTVHKEISLLSRMTKDQAHKKNREDQLKAGLGVRDDFLSKDIQAKEASLVAAYVVEGRSPVYFAEEAIFIELAKLERKSVLRYQERLRDLRKKIDENKKRAIDYSSLQKELDDLLLEYQVLLNHIDKNRKTFEEGLLKREMARIHDQKMGRVRDVISDTDSINQQHFFNKVPPFISGSLGFVVESNGALELSRGWGHPTGEFGGFFSTPRYSSVLAPEESREIMATPSTNAHTHWSYLHLPKGDIAILGLTAPQRNLSGEEKLDWGIGGNGGELQYWRPSRYSLHGKVIDQKYLVDDDVKLRVAVSTLSPRLRELQSALIPQRNQREKVMYLYDDVLKELERIKKESKVDKKLIDAEELILRDYFRSYYELAVREKISYYIEGFNASPQDTLRRWGALILDYKQLKSDLLTVLTYLGYRRILSDSDFNEMLHRNLKPLRDFYESERSVAIRKATSPNQVLAYEALKLEE